MKPIMRGNVSKVLEKNMLNVYHIIYITIFMAELGGLGQGTGDRGWVVVVECVNIFYKKIV